MTFDVFDDVLLLHLAFEATECAFERLALAYFNFCQTIFTSLLA